MGMNIVFVAALLGGLVGWLLKRFSIGEVEAEYRELLEESENRMRLLECDTSARIARLHGVIEDRNLSIARMAKTFKADRGRVEAMKVQLEAARSRALEIEGEFPREPKELN